MKYYFFGLDPFDYFTERDIINEDYKELIETCFKYSQIVSFIKLNDRALVFEKFQPYKINVDDNVFDHRVNYFISQGIPPHKMFFESCQDVQSIMLECSNNIFEWYNTLPEDPTFYRKDGSVFLYCRAHDDICVIDPKDDEDVTNIISKPGWIPEDKVPEKIRIKF